MTKDKFSHLPLPLKCKGIPKIHGGGGDKNRTKDNKKNKQSHGTFLKSRATKLSDYWKNNKQNRLQNNLPEILSGIPLLLQIEPDIDIEFLRSSFDFEIVSELEDGYIIISTDDIDLDKFNNKVDDFINDVYGGGTAARVYGLSNESDRLKCVLSDELYSIWGTLDNNKEYTIDIGVECSGASKLPEKPKRGKNDSDEKYQEGIERWERRHSEEYMKWDDLRIAREESLEELVKVHNGTILDSFDEGIEFKIPDSFTVRIKINGLGLRDIANNYSYAFEIMIPDDVKVHTKVSRGCEPKNSKGCGHLFQCLFSYKIQSNSD